MLILFSITSIVKAQSTLTFAYTVDDKGKTTSDNSKFNLRDGDEIKMLVKNGNGFNTPQFQYKIYRMSCSGEKTYSTTFYQDITTTGTWAYKGIIPHASGYYYIEVLDKYDGHLCDGIFYISL